MAVAARTRIHEGRLAFVVQADVLVHRVQLESHYGRISAVHHLDLRVIRGDVVRVLHSLVHHIGHRAAGQHNGQDDRQRHPQSAPGFLRLLGRAGLCIAYAVAIVVDVVAVTCVIVATVGRRRFGLVVFLVLFW